MTPHLLVLLAGLTLQTAPPAASTDVLGQAYFLFVQGRMLEGVGDPVGAIAAYRQALAIAPAAAEIRAELAGVLARQGHVDEAVTEAQAALKSDAANHEAHRILGLVQAALADNATNARQTALMTDAISHLERAMASGARDLGVQLTLGRLYVRVGQSAKGIEMLRLFLLDQPGYPEALALLAEAYNNSHQPAQAVSVLEELVAAQPTEVRPRSQLAELYEQTGRWKDAAAAWGALAALGQRATAYRMRQAMALVSAGDLAAGRQELLDVTKESPRDNSAWYLLSAVERRAGNFAAAEAAARHIADIDPKDVRGPLALAEVQSARGDYHSAIATLDPLVRAPSDQDVQSGTYARVVMGLAGALEQAGENGRAVSVLEDARRRDGADQDLLFQLGSAYERAGQIDQAERVFRGLITTDPQNAEALNYLGYMLADRGQKLDEAVDLIKRALVVEVDNPSYLDSLGWAYVKQAKLDVAREPLERAAAALPKTSVILDHLGELYFQLKRYRDAADAWDHALGGDRVGIDVAAMTKRRDRARELAGK
jgi:tetratricopeptide (TPR) repeat protein